MLSANHVPSSPQSCITYVFAFGERTMRKTGILVLRFYVLKIERLQFIQLRWKEHREK